MRTQLFIALLLCVLGTAIARSVGSGDKFVLEADDCGPYGHWEDGACICVPHFHGKKCEIHHSRRCTKDAECGKHAYCATKLFIQCRFSAHCKDPSGWCTPIDPIPED